MVSKRHVSSSKRMWFAWAVIALGVASTAAQDSSTAQVELPHDTSITVRHSLRFRNESPETFLSRQTSLTVLGSLPSGSHTHKVMRPLWICSILCTRARRKTRRNAGRVACNPNLILCLAVTSSISCLPKFVMIGLSIRSRFSK
jgi:hypothetical protein